MYFAKNEMIELDDGTKYLVQDSAFLDEVAYYKITEIVGEELGTDTLYVSASNENGKLYLNENLSDDIVNKLKEIMK